MTIKLLVAYQDFPAGARLSRDLVFENRMVDTGKATFNLTGSFKWPVQSTDEILGPFPAISDLSSAYTAADHSGFTALVGTVSPYSVYFSNGVEWLAMVGSRFNSVSGKLEVVSDIGVILATGTTSPDNGDGRPDGSIYIQY